MFQIIKDVIAIYKQNAETRKALRLLAKQEWSVEFLTSLLIKASKATRQDLEMTIQDKTGRRFTISTATQKQTVTDDNILDHLDDEVAIQNFMLEMEKKR